MLILDVLTFFTHFVSVWFWILNRKLWINHLFLLFLSMQGLLNCKTECHSNWSENFIWHKCTSHSQFNQSKHEQEKKVIPVVYLLLTYFVFCSGEMALSRSYCHETSCRKEYNMWHFYNTKFVWQHSETNSCWKAQILLKVFL